MATSIPFPTVSGREGWYRIGTEPGVVLLDTNTNLGAIAGDIAFLPGCSIKHFQNTKIGRKVIIAGHYLAEVPKLTVPLQEVNLEYLALIKGDSYDTGTRKYKSKDYKVLPTFCLEVKTLLSHQWPVAVADEQLAVGDGNTKAYTGTLDYRPKRGSVIIGDGVETFTDNGEGVLVSSLIATGGANGTINYATGAYAITFKTNVVSSVKVEADYTAWRSVQRVIKFYSAVLDSDQPADYGASDENDSQTKLTFIAGYDLTKATADEHVYEIYEEYVDELE